MRTPGSEHPVTGGFVKGRVIDKLDNTQMGDLLTDFGLLPAHGVTTARPRLDDAVE